MKTLTAAVMILMANPAWSQDYKTTFEETVPVAGITTVIVSNIFGPVAITGQSSEVISIDAHVEMSGRNQDQLDRLKNELTLGMQRRSDTLLIYNKAPWIHDPYVYPTKCHNRWDTDKDGQFWFDIKVSLPANINVEAATVNDGDINIVDISGRVSAHNVNGSIHLLGVTNVLNARTINGELTAQFAQTPTAPGSFYALNGHINSTFPDDLSADIRFKSFNGEFFTDFDFTSSPQAAVISIREHPAGTKYKLEDKSGIKIGSGGVALLFETLNGNMYVKRK